MKSKEEIQKQRRRLHNILGRALKLEVLNNEDKRSIMLIRTNNYKKIKKQ